MKGPQKGILCVFTGSHNYVFYKDETKINLAENIHLEKVILHPFKIVLVMVSFSILGLGMMK